MPTISPARTSNDTPRTASSSRSSQHAEVVDLEQRLRGARRRLLDAQEHVAADHQPRELRLRRACGGQRLDLLAAAQHGDAVGDLQHLVELVADEDDRHALAHEVLEDAEELERLLRREHGGRLVEDEDVRAAVERLEDLDALLLADGDVLDARVGIDREVERLGELLHALVAPRRRSSRTPAVVGSCASTMFSATVITGMSMKCWCTMPIPRSIASFGEWMRTGLPLMRISPSSGW